jgi:hypothetical protein
VSGDRGQVAGASVGAIVVTPTEGAGDAELLAPTAELALFVGGLLLTLLVIAFVAALVVVIVREERAAARTKNEAMSSAGAAREEGVDR